MKIADLTNQIGLSGFDACFKIKKVFKVRSGDSTYSPGEKWTMQDIEVEDETGSMFVCLKNKGVVKQEHIGMFIHIRCGTNNKGERVGTTIKENKYKSKGQDKVVVQLVVTGQGSITLSKSAQTPQPAPAQEATQAAPPPVQPQSQPKPQPEEMYRQRLGSAEMIGAIRDACMALSDPSLADDITLATEKGFDTNQIIAVALVLVKHR